MHFYGVEEKKVLSMKDIEYLNTIGCKVKSYI